MRIAGFPLVVGVVLATILCGVLAGQVGAVQGRPTYRVTVTLVPIDVRVTDRSGRPVTDLRREDFSIVEDGAAQEIRHFETQAFGNAEAGAPVPPTGQSVELTSASVPAEPLPIRRSPTTLGPQRNRVFLIVLGRGRLQEPSKGLVAAAGFVRTQLLPHDQVALFAYDRATGFTTDHERVAQIIDRFARENATLDMEMTLQMAGLASVYGSKAISQPLQAAIDRVFAPAGNALPVRDVPPAENARTGERTSRDFRNRLDSAFTAAVSAGQMPAADASTVSDQPTAAALLALDGFVANVAQTLKDFGNLYAAVSYLGQRDGEKHLVFVTEAGLDLPRAEDDQDLGRAASDARVAIDVVQTGGTARAGLFAAQTLRTLSDLTGGIASLSEYSTTAFSHIDAGTRSGYLLGYYPARTTWDGAFRRIDVKVNRRDVTVSFRRGYFARVDIPSFDHRAVLTEYRLAAALRYRDPLHDVGVTMKAALADGPEGREIRLDSRVDPSALCFVIENGVYLGHIDIAVIGTDVKGQILTRVSQSVDLRLAADVYARVLHDGIPYRLRTSTLAGTRLVKIAVYDYAADLVGTARSNVW